jgi:branched-chain amino acid aminotransferase
MTIFIHNGIRINEKEPFLVPESRGYRYGDGFFESMKYSNGRLLHSDLHFIRIRKSAMLLKINLPENFNQESLEKQIDEAAKTDDIVNARIRCTIFRESAGLYTPIHSDASVLIEIQKIDTPGYEWNEQGLKLGAFNELTKNSNFTSTIKTNSALTYVMAGIYAKENGYDDCILYNDYGRVAETVASNIFIVSGEFINTPPLSEYCVDGVMRRVVMQLAQAYGYTIQEQPISAISMHAADEIFLTSATRGIRWVEFFEGKRFRNTAAKVIHNLLNKVIPPDVKQ